MTPSRRAPALLEAGLGFERGGALFGLGVTLGVALHSAGGFFLPGLGQQDRRGAPVNPSA
ncbi:MAG: hypothetical protein LBI48_04475 [Burkholderiaceae bacterium]|nr:hypothetical protein [Burkholderiaceae bacterium]